MAQYAGKVEQCVNDRILSKFVEWAVDRLKEREVDCIKYPDLNNTFKMCVQRKLDTLLAGTPFSMPVATHSQLVSTLDRLIDICDRMVDKNSLHTSLAD